MVEMSDIVSKLVELSGQNRVPWKSSSDESTFVAAYGDLSVMIISRGNEPADTITLAVFDGSGTIIDRASYNGPASFSGVSGPPNYGELKPLYESAKRIALGVDERLSELMERMNAAPPNSAR